MINQLISFHNSKIICCHQIFFKVVRFTHVQHSQSVRRASCILHHLSISFIFSSFICSYPFTHLNLILKFTCIYYYILFFNTIFFGVHLVVNTTSHTGWILHNIHYTQSNNDRCAHGGIIFGYLVILGVYVH